MNRIVGAFVTWRILYAPHAFGAPRKRRCARTRFTQLRAWAAPVSNVRGARCASLVACAWQSSPRAHTRSNIGARFPASSYWFFILSFRTELCQFLVSAPLILCISAPLRLCSALVSLRCSSFCSSLCAALRCALLFLSRLRSALLSVVLFTSLVCFVSALNSLVVWVPNRIAHNSSSNKVQKVANLPLSRVWIKSGSLNIRSNWVDSLLVLTLNC